MASALTVKAFLQREGMPEAEPEIRRFTVETTSGTDIYRALADKVAAVFPGVRPGTFTLHWKDEDDDLVQFSSQEELLHANQMSDGTLKIYVFAADSDDCEETEEAVTVEEVTEDGTTRHVTFETPLQAPPLHHPRLFMGRRWGGPGMRPAMQAWRMMGMKKKLVKKMMKEEKAKCKEFHALASKVPQPFRQWVRIYVRNWFFSGEGDAGVKAPECEKLPEGAPENFRQWLSDFLAHYKEKKISKTTKGMDAEEMEVWVMEDEDGEMQEKEQNEFLPAPAGLPPVYYQWICSFLPRFVSNHGLDGSDDMPAFPGRCGGPFHGPGFHGHGHHGHGHHGHGHHGHGHWKHHGLGHGKHGCKGKGRKHGWHSSSDSEDNECPHEQLWKKIPKEFRVYVRKLIKQLHKNKGDKPSTSDKLVAPPGMTPEVNQFLQQFVQDWHTKLTEKRPHAVSMEMMQQEGTTLPAGLDREHFQWLCRFMARWHRRHAGKCDIMGNWSSGDTSDDTSGDEGRDSSDQDAGCGMYGPGRFGFGGWPRCRGSKRRFQAAMMAMRGFPGHGFPGNGFSGNGHPFHPPPPPPHHGFPGNGHPFHPPPPPHVHFMGAHPGQGFGCPAAMGQPAFGMGACPVPPVRIGCPGRRGCCPDKDTKRRKNQDGAAAAPSDPATTESDMMDRVTEGVRKM